jgi:hypothetical protein
VTFLLPELCGNGLDDDGDGTTDCADAECRVPTCSTGLPGVCGVGAATCVVGTGVTCATTRHPGEVPEACNGLDDDCDGATDEALTVSCYDGPAGTSGVGLCTGGVKDCVTLPSGDAGYSLCTGQVLPAVETCNGLDDDCDGSVDEEMSGSCYTGAASTVDAATGLPLGVCAAGTHTCAAGEWSVCSGELLPGAESCGLDGLGNGLDDDCDGEVDEGCGCNEEGAATQCYGGPTGTSGVGVCRAGHRLCSAGTWGSCLDQVLPTPEVCGNGVDDDCDGLEDAAEAACNACAPVTCYEGPPGTNAVGLCHAGLRACAGGVYGACEGQVLPIPELCDGKDNDCNGEVDDGYPACVEAGSACVNGVCVPATCDLERRCPVGYECDPGAGCRPADCGGSTCVPGLTCVQGTCADPCDGITCGTGAVCASGQCTGGGCYLFGCGSGLLCREGLCVADPCMGVACSTGSYCREGACVLACALVTCDAGDRCGLDGACSTDPCFGVACAAGSVCRAGSCAADLCEGVWCGPGLACSDGACVDDPCAGVTCPVGVCSGGQCILGAP